MARPPRKSLESEGRAKGQFARDLAPGARNPADLAGVHPARQSRSRAKQDALITSGIRMLADRDYNSLSIADLTAANGVSVGAFYARFSGKDAYFNALQNQVFTDIAREAEMRFAPAAWADEPARAVLDAFVAFFVGLVRQHRGVLFAALQHETSQPTAWTPVRKSGAAVAAPFASVLAGKLTHLPPAQRAARVGFAVQVLYGTLINAVLHDPGPMALADTRLTGELQRLLAAYLDLAKPGRDSGRETLSKLPAKRRDKAENGR